MSESDRLRARLPALAARARVYLAIRDYFDSQGFLEVDTPARVFSPGQEVHLDAVPADGGRHLITSPEYHMKRLVAGGAGRIYQLCRAFRAGEVGPHHQPEFTILEWYRAHEPLDAIAADCEQILRLAAQAVGAPNKVGTFQRTTVRALVQRHAQVTLAGDESAEALRAKLKAAGVEPGAATAWDDLFFQMFLDRVEPQLGRDGPTFVFDWPAPLGALARRKRDDPRLVERFELYAGGLELVNAFGELTDPVEQRRRFEEEAAIRGARGKAVYPIDEKLLAALARMPETSGAAMGVDRLLMLVLGTAEIRDVLAFAEDEV